MIDKILELDKILFLALNFDGGTFGDWFFWLATGKLTWIPLYLLIMWLIYRRYGIRDTIIAIVFIVVMVAATDQICNFFKYFTPKLRPTHNPEFENIIHTVMGYRGGLSGSVSAHAAISFGIMLFSSILIRSRIYFCLMVLWASLVAYSRIYVGAHYPLDILLGIITGMIVATIMAKLFMMTVTRLDKRCASIDRPLKN